MKTVRFKGGPLDGDCQLRPAGSGSTWPDGLLVETEFATYQLVGVEDNVATFQCIAVRQPKAPIECR